MARYRATANFRHCVNGEVYDIDPDEWAATIAAGFMVPFPAEDDDEHDWLAQVADVQAGIAVTPEYDELLDPRHADWPIESRQPDA
jgi:hypothetical protein